MYVSGGNGSSSNEQGDSDEKAEFLLILQEEGQVPFSLQLHRDAEFKNQDSFRDGTVERPLLLFSCILVSTNVWNCWGPSFSYFRSQSELRGRPPAVPANMDMSKLCAVLILHKVIADMQEFEPYVNIRRSSTHTSTTHARGIPQQLDIHQLRARAVKTADKIGQFLTPFAFGAVPLLEALGNNSEPSTPSSSLVSIPLFRLPAGLGEKPIVNHLMFVMCPG